jgi:hypothetical protein
VNLAIWYVVACNGKNGSDSLDDGSSAKEDLGMVCPSEALFSRAPINFEDVTSMGVLGSLIPPGHTFPTPHLYMYVIDSEAPQDIEADVHAPADLILKTVVYKYQPIEDSTEGYTDFDLHFQICEDVWLYFIHVRRLTHPDILAAMGEGSCPDSGADRDYIECHLPVDISLTADAVIGTTGDLGWAFGMDVGVRDYRISDGRTAFANPDRWCGVTDPYIAQRCYTACFFDYLDENTAAPYYDLFAKIDGGQIIQRQEDPVCGTVYLDVDGTAQGYWFPSKEPTTNEVNSLFLGPNDYLPSKHSISTGNGIPNLASKVYTFTTEASGFVNREFNDIADTEIYCFDTLYDSLSSLLSESQAYMDFIILLQLADDGNSMTIEKQELSNCGSGPWNFTAIAVEFFR